MNNICIKKTATFILIMGFLASANLFNAEKFGYYSEDVVVVIVKRIGVGIGSRGTGQYWVTLKSPEGRVYNKKIHAVTYMEKSTHAIYERRGFAEDEGGIHTAIQFLSWFFIVAVPMLSWVWHGTIMGIFLKRDDVELS